MRAYITLLSTMNYLPGVVVLHDSLKKTRTSHPLWVGISMSLPEHIDAELRRQGMQVIRLPGSIKIPDALKEKSGHWGNTFDKLHLFGLTDFDKLVYLDSDMMVLKNIDELFDKPHLSAVAAGCLEYPDWTRLNSGLMVIQPEAGLPEKIAATLEQALEQVSSIGCYALGDQDLINAYYPDWPVLANLHLGQGYNLFYSHMDAYINRHGYHLPADIPRGVQDKEIRVVHFVGRDKPWMKWAGLKHFSSTFRKRAAVRQEREIFMAYIDNLKKLKLQKAII